MSLYNSFGAFYNKGNIAKEDKTKNNSLETNNHIKDSEQKNIQQDSNIEDNQDILDNKTPESESSFNDQKQPLSQESASNNSEGGGFAQKYQSRKGEFAQKSSTFTSQNLQESEFNKHSDKTQKNSSSPPKKVDPQKKLLANLIYLVKGVDDGRNAWYYVLVERLKVNMFLKALSDDIIHLENYGKILYSAYGDEPPKDITDALKDEYGIEG